MWITKRHTAFLLIIGMAFSLACKKEKGVENGNPNPNDTVASKADLVKDTVLLFSRDIYLWNDQIPSTFNPRNYADPDKIMTAIRAYSSEPGFSQPVDRYSFAIAQAEWDNVSTGVVQDFGLSVFFLQEGDLRVKLVEEDSPAGKAGVRRGWQITKIAGNTNITTGNADFIVDKVFYSPSTAFTFKKPDGSSVDITLNAATYQENPIFLDTVYNTPGENVGYLVFNSFLGDTAQVSTDLDRIFHEFDQENVSDVVVDLRYNGGGYVSVQQELANYLTTAASDGQRMMTQKYNDNYSQYNESVNFSKLGALNLNRIFFIVSESTASASELLINNLRPYMNVKLVGPSATYGKPVGFFPIPVGDWYIFPVSFRSTNANDEGNYFDGFAPDKEVADGLNKDWGDKDEACLASVLKYISTGDFGFVQEIPGTKAGSAYKQANVKEGNNRLSKPEFKGAIIPRKF